MNNGKEAMARIKINKLLEKAGWIFDKNVKCEVKIDLKDNNDFEKNTNGFCDYLLYDKNNFPLCVLEAKSEKINPLFAKEQARKYANSNNARFIILSNGNISFLWDLKAGEPQIITTFPTQNDLTENKKWEPNPNDLIKYEVDKNFIVATQYNNYKNDPELNGATVDERAKFKYLRYYQIDAIKKVQQAIEKGKNRFLFEMATGTGKTLTTAAIIKLFLITDNAKRVLFLVDRIELEEQAKRDFDKTIGKGYKGEIYKKNKNNWNDCQIVISTIQTMLKDYKSFNKNDFDLVISDEAHRSISGEQRAVFEYFNGYKLGLTATPKNYLKNAKLDDNYDERQLRDTYNTFGCSVGEPTFRYTLEQGTKDGFLVQPWVIDCRTDITIELLSEDGYKFIKISEEDGEKKSIEVFYKKSDFERSFFSEETNKSFCKAFLDNAKRDPISDEIGKTIFFCVSQNHASKIANILNIMMGRSDFAIQVTSQVADSQEMTRKFTKDVNKLLGKSEKIKDYDTSKARVCCTVGMMTTGYDCEDLLNVVLCRPIMSPSEFIQIKGRGTRKTKFEHNDKIIEKDNFYLFDYFGNYIFFEKNFNYDKKLKLLKNEDRSLTTIIIYDKEEVENFKKDPIKTKSTIQIENSMRVDRETFGRIRDELNDKITMNIQDINDIKQYWETDKFDRPELYLNWEKLRELINVDYRASPQEIIENIVFNRDLPRADDLINNAFGNFIINKDINCDTKILRDFFELYLKEKCFRDIIDRKCYAKLNNTMSFTLTDLKKIENFIVPISDYVKDNFISDKFLGD